MLSLLSLAFASSAFDPASPEAVFTGDEVMSHELDRALWGRIDRYGDPDRELLQQEEFNAVFQWKDSEFSPHMRTLFGTDEPHSSQFLLHYGNNHETATGTPVLLVHGAGDNASRAAFGLRPEFEAQNRPFFAITFAHPHGDVFMQAEAVANAIEVIKLQTGEPQVDLIAHSKGGFSVLTYTANHAGADWGHAGYENAGTDYRGDVRRMVLVGVPLNGIDTAYRWPASNYFGLDVDEAVAPVSWSARYPFGSTVWWIEEDLRSHDFLPGHGDVFPGQRQLLKRQDHALPGSMPWLGGYSLQQDWYTTYEGGFGLVSHSHGIDAAIEAGGDFVDTLASQGVDPDVEVFLLAGDNPLMPNGDAAFEDLWDGLASASAWQLLLDSIDMFVAPVDATDAEVEGLANGKLVLGEVSGQSDGVLFLDSALAVENIDARGAQVVETRVVDISHTELLIASDTMGATMQVLAGDDPENAWMIDRGDRYLQADTTGWIADVLGEGPSSAGQGARGGDADDALTPDAVDGGWSTMGCSSTGGSVLGLLAPLALVFVRRRD